MPASVPLCQTKHAAIMRQEFQSGIEDRHGGCPQARCGRSRYGAAATFCVIRDQQEDAGNYERNKENLKRLLKEQIMANARRNVEAFREMPSTAAWGAGSAPPGLDAAAKLAKMMWPVSDLFPPEGGFERTLGRRAPPTDSEARVDVHFGAQVDRHFEALFLGSR